MGWESDTNKFKIGDGVNNWTSLDYFSDINSTVDPAFGSSITFEGATANAFETTLTVTDPTADRTITLPDVTGTVITTGNLSDITNIGVFTSTITMEGSSADDFELTLSAGNPTADRTITFPDATGTVALTTDITASNLANDSITAVKLAGDSVTTSKIQNLAVETGKINDLAVTTGKIAEGAVTSAKIANDTIVDADINSAAAIATSKISGLDTALGLKAPLASPALTGDATAVNLTVSGNLTVNGTTTNINSTNLVVEDKNIVLADVETPTDTTADGGGITLKGLTDKTFNWLDATDSWTSSEHLTLNATKEIRLADTDSTHYVGFKSPATVSTNRIWTLPSADGTANQVLKTDGSGTLSWATAGGGGAAFSELMLIGA
jgi:hypothetical protein